MRWKPSRRLSLILAAGLLAGLIYPRVSAAAAPCDPWIARLVSLQGSVEAKRAGGTQWQPSRLDDTYCAGDRIRVGEKSRADIVLANEPVVRLDQNSTITLGGVKQDRTSLVELLAGAIYFFSRMPRRLEVSTAFVNAGVEGTEGLIVVEPDRTWISIFEGAVLAANRAGSLRLTGGQSAVAARGAAPAAILPVRPRDAVRWALYYQPALYFPPDRFQPGANWQGMVRNSIEALRRGDFQAAFGSIGGIPDSLGEPRFFAYRASLLLAVGRVEEAQDDIERALGLDPAFGDAFALRSVIAVAQNEKDRALEAANRAVSADPDSAAALIALSYAQQAGFDLEAALSSLQRAVDLEPQNALAWARLAELWLSFAQLEEALRAAKTAVALDPDLSRTQSVLGFAHLMQVDTEAAEKAFERAIGLDSADPLARLGLGLAKIRDGDLREGRIELDIAVSLDPDNALIRSYLGKAYFEEKLDEQASDQYEMSKQFDPKDPTPYFYDAIRKQTANRPVEALRDLEKAIELNDNRAVYRSRLLLDSDLAARSASLARIYSDLGFEPLALVEGWKSAKADPTDYSAHRFLADTYSALPRHEIARVSELLQSQLLQPLNATPIQPRLAESDLFLIGGGGPAGLAFNEFHPIFNRNGINFQTTGLAGENGTYAGEGVLSGIYKNLSFSLGGFHFQTDGWRTNSDQRDDIANAFIQLQLTVKTGLQFEYRFRNTDSGDLQLNFFRDDVLPNLRTISETETYRAGLRHAWSPNSILLGSLMYQRQDMLSHDAIPPAITAIDAKSPGTRALGVEMQHLFRSRFVHVTSGVGHFNLNREQKRIFEAAIPPILFVDRVDSDANHTNVYLYSNINPRRDLTVTLGAAGDFFKTDDTTASESKNQFNPKFGLTWNLFPDTTLRAAAFRAFRRTLIAEQTLEPTQVAGFNQFFDDIESTASWRYGAAVDRKFCDILFGGLEFSRRDLDVPIPFTDPFTGVTEARRSRWREQLARSYVFFTPHNWLAFSAEYQYERFKRVADFGFGLKEAATHRVPLGFRIFHPSGASLALKATFLHQDGDFQRRGGACCESAKSDFWLLDAAFSYRLPRRHGFLTVGATNLLDRKFKYQETDFNNPSVQPDRMVFFKLTLAF